MDINSFDLGLEAEEVITILDEPDGKLVSIRFKGQSEPELIPINVAKRKIPKMLIEFYEDRLRCDPSHQEVKKKHKKNKKHKR